MTRRAGRPPLAVAKRQITIYIDEDVAMAMEILYMDPHTHRIKYGERNSLITRLLREHFRNLSKDQSQP